MSDQEDFYTPVGGEMIELDEDGFPFVVTASGESFYYANPDEAADAEAEYFPDQFTPEQAIEELSALPPEGREELLLKNPPPTVQDPNFEVAARKTREARVMWATARMEAADVDNPYKSEEFEKYLKMLGGEF